MVFEASSIQQQLENPQSEVNVVLPSSQRTSAYPSSTGTSRTITDSHRPLSFAAVAAAKNKPHAVPVPVSNYTQSQTQKSSNLEQPQPQQIQQSPQSTSTHLNDHNLNKSLESLPSPVSQCKIFNNRN